VSFEPRIGTSGEAMSTIEDVKAAEKRVQLLVAALRQALDQDPNHLADELKKSERRVQKLFAS
jgi:hypothetical protein